MGPHFESENFNVLNLCCSTQDYHIKINWTNLLGPKSQHDIFILDCPFLHDEIKKVVFNLKAEKAPWPDGFPILCYKKFWDIVKIDVFKLCEDFYWGRVNLERINWANIALISKIPNPEDPSHYRPISLISSSLKIISKI